MDVDLAPENALSEGEVEDDEIGESKENDDEMTGETKNKISFPRNVARAEKQWTQTDGGFATGVDIFAKDEQEKLHNRAQRFGLDPNECTGMSDQQLLDLHDSLGITAEDELTTRFEAIHMYGTRDMSTQDVFEYFGKYGPASIEWINDESCNVVWLDRVSAARAFHGLSSAMAGMPVTGKCDPFKAEEDANGDGRSILLVTKSREVELYDESDGKPMEDDEENKENSAVKDLVHVSELDIPVPPGYWRLGMSHCKSKYLLFRFAKRTDRKPYKAERFSQYYKKYGNPNYGGIKGLISHSKKLRMKGVHVESTECASETVKSGDPWGSLAKNWNAGVRERAPEVPATHSKPSKSILDRLGSANKRARVESAAAEDDGEEKDEMMAKKSKVPRMRMYADEEEARVEKVKQLKKIRQLENIEQIIAQAEQRHTVMADLHSTTVVHVMPELRTTDLRNATKSDARAEVSDLRSRIRKQTAANTFHADQMVDVRRATKPVASDHSDNEDDDINVQQKSKVTVIVKKPSVAVKPTVASTIWARLDKEKQKLQQARKNDVSDSSEASTGDASDDSRSDNDTYDPSKFSKALNHRPGFNRDLKSRLGLGSEHKSPLRIEINNDHYKKS
ncbi:hypothetical protein CBL_00974 [Carabus blaptoides fortunei]